MLDDIPLIELHHNISIPLLKFIKRLFDLSLGLFVLFFIYPFIYFIARVTEKTSDFREFILTVPSVLSGKKSFVGPRMDNRSAAGYLGKPGLTGYWYLENSSGVESDKLDFYYAKNQNIWIDLEILGRTFNKMRSKKD